MDASVPRGLRPRHINMNDVAKRAGVSAMTVSRVLHHPETVSEKTRRLLSPGVGYSRNAIGAPSQEARVTTSFG